jgi:hypothetical protein
VARRRFRRHGGAVQTHGAGEPSDARYETPVAIVSDKFYGLSAAVNISWLTEVSSIFAVCISPPVIGRASTVEQHVWCIFSGYIAITGAAVSPTGRKVSRTARLRKRRIRCRTPNSTILSMPQGVQDSIIHYLAPREMRSPLGSLHYFQNSSLTSQA